MRIALGIEYHGTNYHGWQRQKNLPSIQQSIEEALTIIANQTIKLYCAGRTDIGVHALGQVAHFYTTVQRPNRAWILGTNTHLPPQIKIRWAKEVTENFHARFSAHARHYRYFIYNAKTPTGIFHNLITSFPHPLDISLMQQGANFLLGENDFSSFRGSGCQSRSPNRFVEFITIKRKQKIITIDIKANAFLLHMVRNIVGVLLEIGTGKKPPKFAKDVLSAKDRRAATITAPPQGLFLLKIDYPQEFNLPNGQENLNFTINIE